MNKLCNIDDRACKYLNNAIELGRSFAQPKYRGTNALDYLWQGMRAYASHNPQIKYMLEEGGVQFMAFGIDSAFNDCIDGYIFVDLQKLKPAKR